MKLDARRGPGECRLRQKRAGGNNGQPQKHSTSQRRGEACLRSSRVAKRTLFRRRDLWSRFIRPSVRIAFVRDWSIPHGQPPHLKTGPFGLPALAPWLQRALEATSWNSSADHRLQPRSVILRQWSGNSIFSSILPDLILSGYSRWSAARSKTVLLSRANSAPPAFQAYPR